MKLAAESDLNKLPFCSRWILQTPGRYAELGRRASRGGG